MKSKSKYEIALTLCEARCKLNSLEGVEETSEAMYRDLLGAIAREKLSPFYNDAVNLPMAEEYNEAI